MKTRYSLTLLILTLAACALPRTVLATANYVYHERTTNNPGCGTANYVDNLSPTPAQSVTVLFKVEYQNYTNQARVYYTTDGSNPSGAFGTANGTTTVITGTYDCTFNFNSQVIDVASATIPAQSPGTTVKYIISAWHSGGGAEIFANSGEFSTPFTTSAQATVFQYTVTDPQTPGTLDYSYNPNVTGTEVTAMAVQPDGKTIIAGQFTFVGGVARENIARLNVDGSLDTAFTTSANFKVESVIVQPDGKILLAGSFTTVNGTTRNRIARVHSDGSLDTGFNPNHVGFAPNPISCLAMQPDGKIVLGGSFQSVGGMTRNRIARIHSDGTLDTGFNPDANNTVESVAVQTDGKIVLGGAFTTVAGTTRTRIARVHSDGTLDTGFAPTATNTVFGGGTVHTLAIQPDGKILLGGQFNNISGVGRNAIARVNGDGSLDSFNPNADSTVFTLAVQADGKVIFGGGFFTVSGAARSKVARVDSAGSLDGFDPNVTKGCCGSVQGVSVQADGKVLIGGDFNMVSGTARSNLARMHNDSVAQTLSVPSGSRVEWLRSGAGPEVEQVNFQVSTNGGTTWTALGAGTRIMGGWEITGLSLPVTGSMRAQGRTNGGVSNGTYGLVEQVESYVLPIGTLQFSAANYSDNETDTTHNVTVTVTRLAGSAGAISVHYATSNGSANAGSDYTATSGDLNWADGDAADKTFTVSVTGDQLLEGQETINLTLSSPTGGATLGTPNSATITIPNDDAAPTISDIAATSTNEDVATGAIAFTVDDLDTPLNSLTLAGTSDNPGLVPNANVVFGGSGANRTATITPAANQSGTATITVTVSDDGVNSASDTFVLTVQAVNDAPAISDIADTATDENTATGAIAFTVGDVETSAGSLTVSGSSSNTTLVPNGNIAFGGSGANRTVTITPASSQSGSATITVSVSDGAESVSDAFVLTVRPLPSLAIGAVTQNEGDSGTTSYDFIVTKTGATGLTSAVNFATQNGTATTADSDFQPSSGAVSFAPGETTKTITVLVNGDTKFEADEAFTVQLSGETNARVTSAAGTGTILNDEPGDVSLLGGNLHITDISGGANNDSRTILLNGANIRVHDPNRAMSAGPGVMPVNANTIEVPVASVTGNIQVTGLDGNDTLTLNLAGGDFIPDGGLSFAGGNPTTGTGDKLVITGGSQGTVTYNYTNASDGNVVMSNFGTVTYTGLEPITNSGTAADIIFNLPAAANAATLGDDGVAGNTMSRLSGANFEDTDFANPTGSVTINRGNAADTMTTTALPDLTASLTLGGSATPFHQIIFNGAITLAAGNNLTAFANQGTAAAPNAATISLPNAASDLATSGSGSISLTSARNIALASGASITTVDGAVTLNANQQGTPTTGTFEGIHLVNATVQAAGTGVVTVNARGGTVGAGNRGVFMNTNAVIRGGTTAGVRTTDVLGTGGTGGSNPHGVDLENGSTITSLGGDVRVRGFAGAGTGAFNYGVIPLTLGTITSGGNGNVVVEGTGGTNSGGGNVGVIPHTGTGTITSGGNGAVTVTGTGGPGNESHGVHTFRTGRILSGGSGTVTVTGTGGGNGSGVFINPVDTELGRIGSNGGPVVVTGTPAGTGTGIVFSPTSLNATATISSTGNAAVTLIADTMLLNGGNGTSSISAGTGTVTLRQKTNGRLINLGGDDTGRLGLTDSELDRVTAGTMNIGDANSGAISVSAAITQTGKITNLFGPSTTVLNGGSLGIAGTVNSPLSVNAGGSVAPGASPGVLNAGNTGFVSGSTFAVEFGGTTPGNAASNHDQLNVTGSVTLNNATLSLASSGGFVPAPGQSFTIISNDSADPIINRFAGLATEGATISNFLGSGLNATISYQGGSDSNDVVISVAVPTVTTSTANLAANATSMVINGTGFSTTPASNVVTFSGGATGTVTAATTTQLTVSSLAGLVAGPLNASVAVNNVSSGAPVQVATVTPVVTANAATIPSAATSLTINGFGFSSTPANNSVVFSSGTGDVTAATATSLTVTFTSAPSGGALTAVVTSNGQSSGAAVQVATVNDAPTISDIADTSTNEDTATGALAFTVGDQQTAASALTLTGSSDNTDLVPNANIGFGGSGANRTVTITPAANQNGTATITITVSDGALTASDTFILTVTAVNDVPTVSDIADVTIDEDSATAALAFTVGDVETAAGSLIVSGTSSNTTLVPNANIVFGGSGANRTVTITPVANQSGTSTITVAVNDGTDSATDTFVLTVNAVNDAPDAIADAATTNENTPVTVAVLTNDTDTENNSLTISAVTQGTNGGVAINNTTPNTVTYTPTAGFFGTDTFSYTASDGQGGTDTASVTITVVETFLVNATDPSANELAIAKDTNALVTFDGPVDQSTVGQNTFALRGASTARYGGAYTLPSTSSTQLNPTAEFKAGEMITGTLTAGVKSSSAVALRPYTWQFWAATTTGSGRFAAHPTTPSFGTGESRGTALGDLDGDGDLDAVVANTNGQAETTWLNDGRGSFSAHPTVPSFGSAIAAFTNNNDVELADLDADGDLDAVIASSTGAATVWLNDASGGFTAHPTAPTFGGGNTGDIALGDLDGDGDVDALIVNSGQTESVWLNNGSGTFTAHPVTPTFNGGTSSEGVALGDLDGDGDLDALIANVGTPAETVWLNNGSGSFSAHPTTPSFGSGRHFAVALGDLDADGDLDAVIANDTGGELVWRNNGSGSFSAHPTTPTFGSGSSYDVALGDIDADGDLDAVVANDSAAAETVWLNNGSGSFSAQPATPSFGAGESVDVALGDLDGDGDLDALVANYSAQPETVWLNNTAPAVTTTAAALAYTENSTVAVDNGVAVTDPDGTLLSATIAITTGYVDGEDTLGFTNQNGITGSYNSGTGVLTLTGASSVADYQTALRSISYSNSSDNPSTAQRTVSFQVSDGMATSNSATRNITINAVNDVPTISDVADRTTDEGVSTGAIAFSIGDAETTAGTLTLSGSSSNTTLVPNANIQFGGSGSDRTVTVTPAANQSGAATITITVSDGTDSASDTFVLTVRALPTFAIDAVAQNEGNSGTTSYVFTVTKTGATGLASSVQFATQDGTATEASGDYQSKTGTLSFAPADTSKTITVVVNGDTIYEANETFAVNLANPGNARITTASGTGTITNDDTVPTLQFSQATYSANENGGVATLTITKAGASDVAATVHYATSNGTATANADYDAASGDVTFAAGETSKQITVDINDDSSYEGNENFTVTLSAPSNATLGSPSSATVTIVENDVLPVVQFSAPTYSASEGATTATVTVTKTGNTAVSATVQYQTSNDTATAGEDYSSTSGTITFLFDETSKDIAIPLSGDAVYEGNEAFKVTLSNPAGATLGATNPATVTITENDAAPVVQFDPASYSVNEDAGTVTLTLTKSGATAVAATVHYQTSDGTAASGDDYTAASGDVTFQPGDTSKTISVSIIDDTAFEPNENFTVGLSAPSGATVGSAATATVTILTNDAAPEISVEQPADTGLADGSDTVNFGSVAPGDDNSRTFTVRNVGTAPLTGLGITFSGANPSDFSVSASPQAPVAPGQSTLFTIKFTPTAAGARTATLHIASNDADENPFDVALTGNGYTHLEAWRVLHFGSPANSGPGADANDFDGDGIRNVLEFATGSHPKQNNPAPGMLILNGSNMEFLYQRAKGALIDGFTFAVEWKNELTDANWSTSGVTDELVSQSSTLEQRKASVARGSNGKRFLRLRLTPPAAP